jgi:hypothetical protein
MPERSSLGPTGEAYTRILNLVIELSVVESQRANLAGTGYAPRKKTMTTN